MDGWMDGCVDGGRAGSAESMRTTDDPTRDGAQYVAAGRALHEREIRLAMERASSPRSSGYVFGLLCRQAGACLPGVKLTSLPPGLVPPPPPPPPPRLWHPSRTEAQGGACSFVLAALPPPVALLLGKAERGAWEGVGACRASKFLFNPGGKIGVQHNV